MALALGASLVACRPRAGRSGRALGALGTRADGGVVTHHRERRGGSCALPRGAPAGPRPLASRGALSRQKGGRGSVAAEAAAATAAYTPTQWLAVALGYCCVVGSVFRCVPQMHRILTRKSVEGISFTAILSEFLIYSVNLAYNVYYKYPFNTYGDLAVSWFVLIAVLVLMQYFRRFDGKRVAAVVAFSAAWCAMLFSFALPLPVLSALQASSAVALAFGSRIPQIWLNWRQKSTGELSIIMFIANALGCLIRVFTTLSLTGDMILLFSAALHLVLNGIIIAQCVETRVKTAKMARGQQQGLSGSAA